MMWLGFLLVVVLVRGVIVPPLRRRIISDPFLRYLHRTLPPISRTEQEVIDAGTVWWEAELFCGSPDWQHLLDVGVPALTPAEKAFLNGPVDELCTLLDDWQITHELNDLPDEVWTFIRSKIGRASCRERV